jgi:hypothetical protein
MGVRAILRHGFPLFFAEKDATESIHSLKIVEQQLLHSLRETPFETDYSVSVAVLTLLQLATAEQQRRWLQEQREPRAGKAWHRIADCWVFTAQPEVEAPREPSPSLFPRPVLPKSTEAAPGPLRAEPALRRIAVKPVAPLRRAAPPLYVPS